MKKRSTNDSEDQDINQSGNRLRRNNRDGDDPIGLTQAFAPISDVDDDEDSIGLTQAFGPVAEDGSEWDDDESQGKWDGFDWNASIPDEENTDEQDEESKTGDHGEGFSYKGDTEEDFPDAMEALEPVDAPPLLVDEPNQARSSGKRGKHGVSLSEDAPEHVRKSKRVRKRLTIIVIIFVVLLAALAFFGYRIFTESQSIAVQQAQSNSTSSDNSLSDSASKDTGNTSSKLTEVPNLSSLLGKTQDEAVTELQHGATVTASRDVNEEGNAVKRNVTIALTAEPADSKTGTPTVYLGLDEAGTIIQVGYSASASALGFGTLSFADAVNNEHVIENTLREGGIQVADGAAVLPADKTSYSTYASDGTTLVRERCSFSGDVTVNGTACTWSAVLSYDYTTANLTGNLADTVRVIYVYVTQNS